MERKSDGDTRRNSAPKFGDGIPWVRAEDLATERFAYTDGRGRLRTGKRTVYSGRNIVYAREYGELREKYDAMDNLLVTAGANYFFVPAAMPVIFVLWAAALTLLLTRYGVGVLTLFIFFSLALVSFTVFNARSLYLRKRRPEIRYYLRSGGRAHLFHFESPRLFRYFNGDDYIEIRRDFFRKKGADGVKKYEYWPSSGGKDSFYRYCGAFLYDLPLVSFITRIKDAAGGKVMLGRNGDFNAKFKLFTDSEYSPLKMYCYPGGGTAGVKKLFFGRANADMKIYAPALLKTFLKERGINLPEDGVLEFIGGDIDVWKRRKTDGVA